MPIATSKEEVTKPQAGCAALRLKAISISPCRPRFTAAGGPGATPVPRQFAAANQRCRQAGSIVALLDKL